MTVALAMPQKERIVGFLQPNFVTAGVAVFARCIHHKNEILESVDSYQLHCIKPFVAFLSIQVLFIAYKMYIAY